MAGVSPMSALRSAAVGDWEACGDTFYARELLYDMVWDDVDLQTCRVTCAPYGGPIAIVRDERRLVVVTSGTVQPIIRTFAASGRSLGAVAWERGRIVEWGWSDALELLTVDETGRVCVFSMHGEKLREFGLGPDVERAGVAAARVGGDSLVVLTRGAAPPQQGHPLTPGAAATASTTTAASSSGGAPPAPSSSSAAGAPNKPGQKKPPVPALWAVSGLTSPRVARLADLPECVQRDAASEGTGGAGDGGGGAAGLRLLGGGGGGGAPRVCLAVLEPHLTASGALEVLVGSSSGVCRVDDESVMEHLLPGQTNTDSVRVLRLAVSSNGQFIAAYTSDGVVRVSSADFSRQLSEFDTKADTPPLELLWCGSDAVLLRWPELLLLVGPYGDAASWETSGEAVSIVQEVDGARVLSNGRHELLRKVPAAVADVQRPGSTAPAAQLWDARDLFEQANAAADRMLRQLGPCELSSAVASCIDAAGLDLCPPRQKALLRAAALGSAFCAPAGGDGGGSGGGAIAFYSTCTKLRVLNALREPSPGMPLTMPQLEALTLPVVVGRLVAYHEWLLAYQIAGTLQQHGGGAAYTESLAGSLPPPTSHVPTSPALAAAGAGLMGLPSATPALGLMGVAGGSAQLLAAAPQERVLLQWAAAKISAPGSASLSDSDLKDRIAAKLRECPGCHYAPLAGHAQAIGRRTLALKLLEEETSCSLQVPLLLSLSIGAPAASTVTAGAGAGAAGGAGGGAAALDEDGDVLLRALRKAVESGDTDLVYLVLFHTYKHRSLQDFWAIISSRALARNLFLKFCRAREPELLETILTVRHQVTDLADHQVATALKAYVASHTVRSSSGSSSSTVAAGAAASGDQALLKLTAALSDAGTKYGTSRDHVFQAKAAAEFAQLRREQARLERESGQRLFVGLSLVATVTACVRLGHHKAAHAFKKNFSMSDRRFYWVKVLTLCEERQWAALDEFAAERKSPIGWEPFLQLAKKHGAPNDALARIISKMPDSIAKAEAFSAIDCAREAAEVAAKLRDSDLFARIQGAVAANSPAGLAIAQIQERFRAAGFR